MSAQVVQIETRIAQEGLRRWRSLVEPVLGIGRENATGNWGTLEYSYPCPIHAPGDPTSDGLILGVAQGDCTAPRWACRTCTMPPQHGGTINWLAFLKLLQVAGIPRGALPWQVGGTAGRASAHTPTAAPWPTAQVPTPVEPLPSEAQIAAWTEGLRANTSERSAWRFLVETRMWDPGCIELLQIGAAWRHGRYVILIPVRRADGSLDNVRIWDPNRTKGTGARWQNWPGHGRGQLWPLPTILAACEGERVYLCAGEPDAMVAMSRGYVAVTSTGGEGKALRPEDLPLFAGKRVVVVYDSDAAGRAGAEAAVQALREYGGCRTVHNKDLWPDRDDGADLTDWIRGGKGVPMPLKRTRSAT